MVQSNEIRNPTYSTFWLSYAIIWPYLHLIVNPRIIMETATLSDQELFNLCRKYGSQALEARRKFIGLLPEVNRRKLYEQKGFTSIFHFAAVLAGVSEEQVSKVIMREKQFANMPAMKNLLVTGQVSMSKINAVASIVTPENDSSIAQKTADLPRAALETYVRDIKIESQFPGELKLQQSSLIVKEPNLSPEIKLQLVELQEKGIDINDLIAQALARREQEILADKDRLAEKAEQKLIEQITEGKIITRRIPVETKRLLKKEYGNKCAKPFCPKPAVEIHHTARFSVTETHDPHYMAPLCKQHHQLAHAMDVRVAEERWKRHNR